MIFFLGFGVLFVGIWVLGARYMANTGWSRWLESFRAPREPYGKKIGMVSGSPDTGQAHYSGALNVWLSPEGLFIRPTLPFRAFHPALLIPWSHLTHVEENKVFLTTCTTVEIESEELFFSLQLRGARSAELQRHAPQLSVGAEHVTDASSG